MGDGMEATLGVLTLLKALSEGPASRRRLEEALEDAGIRRDKRTIRRWLHVLREAEFGIVQRGQNYEMHSSPARINFGEYEALATLSVVESLAEREPVYGDHLGSAARKLREIIPKASLDYADAGRIEFALESVSDPPETPEIMDKLRRSTRRRQRVDIFYHSLKSDSLRWRTVEPVGISYSQRAHRLHAYDKERNRVIEFRVNRIQKATVLPDKFSPEAHTRFFTHARIRLSKNTFIAYGKKILPDEDATIKLLDDGGAIIEGKTPSVFWTVREVAALGPDAEVLGGNELKEKFASFLKETLRQYSE